MKKRLTSEQSVEYVVMGIALISLFAMDYHFISVENYSLFALFGVINLYFIYKILYKWGKIKFNLDAKIDNAFIGLNVFSTLCLVTLFVFRQFYILANIIVVIRGTMIMYKILKAPAISFTNPIIEKMDYVDKKEYKKNLMAAYIEVEKIQIQCEAGKYKNEYSVLYFLLLLNTFPWKLDSREDDYKLLIDAIHIYHRENNYRGVNEIYIDGICCGADVCVSKKGFENCFKFLQYELEKAKNDTNTFDFDFESVLLRMERQLHKLKDNVEYCSLQDEKKYQETKNDFENGFENWFYKQKSEMEREIKKIELYKSRLIEK